MPIDKMTGKPVEIKSQKQITCSSFHGNLFETLRQADSNIYEFISNEYDRQTKTLQLVAAENQCSRACLAALGSILQNKTAEGAVAERLHGGCKVVDDIEKTAIERAKQVFGTATPMSSRTQEHRQIRLSFQQFYRKAIRYCACRMNREDIFHTVRLLQLQANSSA